MVPCLIHVGVPYAVHMAGDEAQGSRSGGRHGMARGSSIQYTVVPIPAFCHARVWHDGATQHNAQRLCPLGHAVWMQIAKLKVCYVVPEACYSLGPLPYSVVPRSDCTRLGW